MLLISCLIIVYWPVNDNIDTAAALLCKYGITI